MVRVRLRLRLGHLLEMKTTSLMRDWMMSFAHSLHGNRVTYIVQPLRDSPGEGEGEG